MKSYVSLVLYADEDIYLKLHERIVAEVVDEKNQIHTFHPFDREGNELRHISSSKYINYSINNISGYQSVTHVIIQKSFYRNIDIVKILRKFHFINPNCKVLLLMDDDPDFYEMLLSIIAKEQLCSIAFTIEDVQRWLYSNGELFDQRALILKSFTRKQKRDFIQY